MHYLFHLQINRQRHLHRLLQFPVGLRWIRKQSHRHHQLNLDHLRHLWHLLQRQLLILHRHHRQKLLRLLQIL
jgi:hypothetical protein